MVRRPDHSARAGVRRPRFATLTPIPLLLGAALSFAPVVGGSWLADDFYWVGEFAGYPWHNVPRLFGGEWSRTSSGEYRPLWALTYIVDLRLWGPTPWALHLTNIALHVAAAALVWRLVAGSRMAGRGAAPLALAYFVVAPVHDEPVAWIAARGHILAPVCILAAILLLRRAEHGGGRWAYLASLGAAIAAFATQEVAVALPALLLMTGVAEHWPIDRARLRRLAARHAPFWGLLAAYLCLRLLIFGQFGRDGTIRTGPEILRATYVSVRTLWLAPLSLPQAQPAPAGGWATALLCLLIAAFLLAPAAFLPAPRRADHARGVLLFAVGWPVVATVVLLGANDNRHFYLASVGPAVALGLAAARWLSARRPLALAGVAAAAALLVLYGGALGAGIAEFARNGERSLQLRGVVDATIARAEAEPGSIVVVLAQPPDNRRVLWDYFYPAALAPPFTGHSPAADVIPNFTSCHCAPQDWRARHAAPLARLTAGAAGVVYVVEWDARQGQFAARGLDADAFRDGGYLTPGGRLLPPDGLAMRAPPDGGSRDRPARRALPAAPWGRGRGMAGPGAEAACRCEPQGGEWRPIPPEIQRGAIAHLLRPGPVPRAGASAGAAWAGACVWQSVRPL